MRPVYEVAVELYQLKTFVAVADEGNLSRAAERLFLSQPAVSAQIKALEEELGVILFARTPKGMEPTPAGRVLRDRAEATLRSADDFLHQARSLNGRLTGSFRLGHNTDPEFLRLSRLTQAVSQEHPGISLELLISNSGEIRHDLDSGRLDAGYIYGESPHPSVETALLTRSRLAARPWLWAPPDCPFHRAIASYVEERSVTPNKVLAANDENMLVALLKAGKGACFLRLDRAEALAARGEGQIWEGGGLEISVRLAWAARRSADPLVAAVRACVRRVWDLPAESA